MWRRSRPAALARAHLLEDDESGDELPEVDTDPRFVACVLGEDGHVVVGIGGRGVERCDDQLGEHPAGHQQAGESDLPVSGVRSHVD